MKKSSDNTDYVKIALIVIIIVIVIAILAGLVYYFIRTLKQPKPPQPQPRQPQTRQPQTRQPRQQAKKPFVFLPPLYRKRPEKIIQPKINVKVSTNKKQNNSNRETNLGLGFLLGASHEKNKEQQIQIEDLKCKQLHGSKSLYNPYTQLCETGVDNAASGNLIPSFNVNSVQTQPATNISGNGVSSTEPVNSVQTQPATNISGNGVSSTEPVNLQIQPSNNLSNMNTVVNNLTNISGDFPVI